MPNPETIMIDRIIQGNPNYSIDVYLEEKKIKIQEAMDSSKEVFDVKELQRDFLPISRMGIHRHIKEGKLIPTKIGNRLLFHIDDIRAFLKRHRKRPSKLGR